MTIWALPGIVFSLVALFVRTSCGALMERFVDWLDTLDRYDDRWDDEGVYRPEDDED
jgi:hypothetical protein